MEQLTLIGTNHGQVVSTKHEKVVLNNGRTNATDLLPCVYRGYTHVMARTVDTDAFSHRIAKFQYIFLSKLWIEFGVGKYLK